MFTSTLLYQSVNLVLAALAARLCARALPSRWRERLAARVPRLLATPMRRLVALDFPLFGAAMLACAVAGRLALFPLFERLMRGFPSIQRSVNGGTFLVLGVTYAGMTVVFPCLALWRAWRPAAAAPADPGARARVRNDRILSALGAAGAASVLWLMVLVEPNRLVIERADVALRAWPAEARPLRLALVADLQSAWLGERERSVPGRVAALAPDVIVIAGDLVSQSFDESRPLEQARWVLGRLAAPLGVLVVNGDVDDVVAGGIRRTIEGTGARLLSNERVVLPTQPPVELAGFDPRDGAAYRALLAAAPLAPNRVAVVHRPRHHREIGAAGFELVLAGHTHGGQVVLPGFGPPITLEVVPREVAAGGLHRMEGGTQLYVTRGIGIEGGFAPPIRAFCPPEISLLSIGPTAGDPSLAARALDRPPSLPLGAGPAGGR